MEVIVTIVSKLVYNLLKGLITYLYRGYNPVSKYHGHPSRIHGKWYMYLRTFIIQINHSCREIKKPFSMDGNQVSDPIRGSLHS